LKQIPGASPVGSLGLWHTYPLHKERTQAAAIFSRNSQLSSTDTILVNLTLALDTPVLISPFLAWEIDSEDPPGTIHDPADGVIPMITTSPQSLLKNEIISSFDQQTTPIVHIFNTTPIAGIDYPDPEPYRGSGVLKKRNPGGFTRYLPLRSENGFRNQIVENLLATDPSLPTFVFGITRLGAIPNSTAVHTRSIWHSCVAVTQPVNRYDPLPPLPPCSPDLLPLTAVPVSVALWTTTMSFTMNSLVAPMTLPASPSVSLATAARTPSVPTLSAVPSRAWRGNTPRSNRREISSPERTP
jgi:hypothetical protein